MKYWLLAFVLVCSNLQAKLLSDTVISIADLPVYNTESNTEPSITVTGPWRFMQGDNAAWADSSFDDSKWLLTNSILDTLRTTPGFFGGIGWFRTRVNVSPEYAGEPLGLMITQSGASEVYIDGILVQKYGMINAQNPALEDRYDPQFLPSVIVFKSGGQHVIAIRYANARAEADAATGKNSAPGFLVKIGRLNDNSIYRFVNSNILTGIFVFYFAFFSALSLLHFIIFLLYRSKRSNLYYSIFAFTFGLTFLCLIIRQNFMDPDTEIAARSINNALSSIYGPALIAMLYSIFYGKVIRLFWLWMALFALDLVMNIFSIEIPYFGLLTFTLFCVESIRVIVASMIKKREGAWIIGSGIIITVTFLLFFTILALTGGADIVFTQRGWAGLLVGILIMYITLSIPIHMSVYLARDFAQTNRKLSKKLIEVEELSEQTVQQEKEKQRILAQQNDMLESQVKERTAEIVEQKKVIEEKNKDITDSIHYARKIQDAMLPGNDVIKRLFPGIFIIYKPKDIVSGDFYWVAENDSHKFIAAADCTGHGVPGALMSMTGNNFLNQVVMERNTVSPSAILAELDSAVRKSLRQDRQETESKDGMDIALCRFNADLNLLNFAGANRPLWLVRNKELSEYKPTKQSIGGAHRSVHHFTEQEIEIKKDDCIYILSDGFADQFGGPEGKKFMSRKLKQLLCEISDLDPEHQKARIEKEFVEWMGGYTQVDDILVIGIRV